MKTDPGNFSWIDSNIAGSALPSHVDHLKYFVDQGITHVLSLTPNKPLVFTYRDDSLQHIHLPIFSLPSSDQLQEYRNLLERILSDNGKLVVHCQFGQERTGILLALYLHWYKGLSLDSAIKTIQTKRLGSLQSSSALRFLTTF
ncbi:MAG: dual specificity protein phosphatase family protein [Candidatus Kariarchaeaceae archaeon]|jgi:atypical dual specificity phosphatase